MMWSAALPWIVIGAIGASLVMVSLWIVQRRTGNAGIVDAGWAGVLGSLAVLYALGGEGWAPRRAILGICGGLWGYRLAWHLLRDRVWNVPEEGRYVTLRKNWAPRAQLAFFLFYQAQGLAAVFLSLPFVLAAFNRHPTWEVTDIIGVLVWLTGIVGESVADQQLVRFKRDPASRGRTCRQGLWRYSRHPNYFFEWLIWVGFACLGAGVSGGWLGFAAPAVLLYLILRVTGIPPTEEQALRSRGDDYRRYQRTTSPFVPWPPRRDS